MHRLLSEDQGEFGAAEARPGPRKLALPPGKATGWATLVMAVAGRCGRAVLVSSRQTGQERWPHSGTHNLAESTGLSSDTGRDGLLLSLLQIPSSEFSSNQQCDILNGEFFVEEFKTARYAFKFLNQFRTNRLS